MSDTKLTDTTGDEDDKIELIPVETPPEEKKPVAEDGPDDDDQGVDDDHGDDEDDGDEKLGGNADDDEAEITGKAKTNRERRLKRREQQRIARENAERELRFLRERAETLEQRLRAVETSGIDQHVRTIDDQLAAANRDVAQAERIIEKATEAGNGADVVAAMRIRDEAMAERNQLTQARQQALEHKQRATAAPGPDPRVANFAGEWAKANPWYNPRGTDEESVTTKIIDAQLAAEGYDPREITYWQELTNRINKRFNGAVVDPSPRPKPKGEPSKGKEPPPQGGTREHAPVTTRKEIYVTPERKQAMIDAGAWDDPVRRAKFLKSYQAYDKSSAR